MTLTLADQQTIYGMFPINRKAYDALLSSALVEWGKLPRPGVRWQFKNGSLATIRRDQDLSSTQHFSAWDRSLGCEVLYDVASRG